MSCPDGVVPTTERVHTTPIYEFLIWILIAVILWQVGQKALNGESAGKIFSYYLILTGVARFLMEFIRINPRSFFGMSNAQTASLVSIVMGIVVLLRPKSAAPAAAKEA